MRLREWEAGLCWWASSQPWSYRASMHQTTWSNPQDLLEASGAKAAVKHPKKTDVGVGSNSFALRLGEPVGHTLGVAEGIETALAATLLDGHPVWPCHSSTILSNFVLPEHLRSTVRMGIVCVCRLG